LGGRGAVIAGILSRKSCETQPTNASNISLQTFIQCAPLATETRHFFNNFTSNVDIATEFEADLPYIHFSHNERNPVQISLQYLHWC
jgi:hypothetical protein